MTGEYWVLHYVMSILSMFCRVLCYVKSWSKYVKKSWREMIDHLKSKRHEEQSGPHSVSGLRLQICCRSGCLSGVCHRITWIYMEGSGTVMQQFYVLSFLCLSLVFHKDTSF